jgi:O-antigen ligase
LKTTTFAKGLPTRGKATEISLRRLGVWLVVATFTLISFVDYTLFKVGSFDVSFQKVVALIVFPVAFVLIREIRVPLPLLVFAAVLVLENSVAYAVESDLLNPLLLSANATALIGFVGAVILYTALVQGEDGFSALGRLWVALAVVTSVLALGQALGLLPLWTISGEDLGYREAGISGLYRGTGLRFDPNFQALVLVVGGVFAQFYLKRTRNAATLLIALGIFGTFSRMGLLIAVLAWGFASVIQAWADRREVGAALLRLLGVVTVLAVASIMVYLFSQEVRSYLDERVSGVVHAYEYLAAGAPKRSVENDSAEARILLVRASLEVLSRNYLVGVGANKPPEFLAPIVGTKNVAHNTYLEELLIGGLLGALTISLYTAFIVYVMRRSRQAGEDTRRRSVILALLFTFGLMAMFLTLHYSIMLWFPLVVALSHSKLSRAAGYGAKSADADDPTGSLMRAP